MAASPGTPPTPIVPSGRTPNGVTTPPLHPLRRTAAIDQALWAWVVRYARCAGGVLDPDEWFPASIEPAAARREAAAAIAVCASCPVRAQCLVLSLRHWDIGQHGVWGGLVAADRALLRRRLPAGRRGRGPAVVRSEGAAAILPLLGRLVQRGELR